MAYTQVRDTTSGLPRGDMIRRDADGAFIPADPTNSDWRAYQLWLAQGQAAAALSGPSTSVLMNEAGRICEELLAKGKSFNVAVAGAAPVYVHCDGSPATRANLALAALAGQTNQPGTAIWIDKTGAATALTGPQCVQLALAASAWISEIYSALVTLSGAIKAMPPRVTTTAQIDAYAWPRD